MKVAMNIWAFALVVAASLFPVAVQAEQFQISGLLRSNSAVNGLTVKLVQGVKQADSATDAVAEFSQEVLAQYPGYSLIDAIASPLAEKPSSCPMFQSI